MNFIQILLNSETTIAAEDILLLANKNGISSDQKQYVSLVLGRDPHPESFAEIERVTDKLAQFLVKQLHEKCHAVYIEQCGLQTYVLVTDASGQLDMRHCIKDLENSMRRHGFKNIRIAVGPITSSLYAIGDSFRAARSIWQYIPAFFNSQLLFFDDFKSEIGQITLDPPQNFSFFSIPFLEGDMDRLRKRLEEKAETVRRETVVQPEGVYPTSIRRTMLEIVIALIHLTSDMGVSIKSAIGDINPYHDIFVIATTPLIIDWVIDICSKLDSAITQQKMSREKRTMTAIRQYIQDHMSDPNLCLDLLSTYTGLSASYLSTLIANKMGSKFTVYLNDLRLERAEYYLCETELSVSDIAERCGFNSSSYFINTFKKHKHITPGEYRRKTESKSVN